MSRRALVPLLFLAVAVSSGAALAEPSVEVVTRSEVAFQPLNPLRGDASPKAGVLWGDIKRNVPTGTLIEFTDGFSSPPHIHNITYRAVVLTGFVHNDDPEAEPLWMGPGSFWTQPAGEVHITAARTGNRATAFLEILDGPYLVQPADEDFDNGERPVNLEARNIVWLDASNVSWIEPSGPSDSADAPRMAFLWGNPDTGEKNGTFLKLPPGYRGELRGNDAQLRAVLVAGEASHRRADSDEKAIVLDPGSYFGSSGAAIHAIACAAGADCLIYISTEGKYAVARTR